MIFIIVNSIPSPHRSLCHPSSSRVFEYKLASGLHVLRLAERHKTSDRSLPCPWPAQLKQVRHNLSQSTTHLEQRLYTGMV
jgi:hypothetical protein